MAKQKPRKRQAVVLEVSAPVHRLVQKAAARLNPYSGALDSEAKSREDYAQDFYLFAWSRFQQQGSVDGALLRRSFWNAATSMQRDRARRASLRDRFFPSFFPSLLPASADDAHADEQRLLEQRSCVELLEKRLSADEVRVLKALADGPTWAVAVARVGLSRSHFATRVKSARASAIRILEEENHV